MPAEFTPKGLAHMLRLLGTSDAATAALVKAFSWRGKRAGFLLADCPRSTTLASAAWQGAMVSANPYKVSIMQTLMMTDEQRVIANEITALFDANPALRLFDWDRRQLERMGAW